jgi:hypothetical protein
VFALGALVGPTKGGGFLHLTLGRFGLEGRPEMLFRLFGAGRMVLVPGAYAPGSILSPLCGEAAKACAVYFIGLSEFAALLKYAPIVFSNGLVDVPEK